MMSLADKRTNDEELRTLISAVCNGLASAAERDRLEELLADDEDAQLSYFLFTGVHAHFCWQYQGRTSEILKLAAEDRRRAPVLGFLGSACSGTANYFSQIGPLSYLIATLIMIAMGVAAHSWKISGGMPVGQDPTPSTAANQSDRELPLGCVGRITGMVNCRWQKGSQFMVQGSALPSPSGRGAGGEGGAVAGGQPIPKTQSPSPKSLVSLGDRFALASGLVEITYNTGAKVILQGPVTYEVDSAASGFLSVGKLTARVEKKGLPSPVHGRGAGGEGGSDDIQPSAFSLQPSSDPQSPIPNPSLPPDLWPLTSDLFVVKTPTAIVTDLGTEFGVDVSQEGHTTSHVYRGSVRLQATCKDGTVEGAGRILHENESARVEDSGQQDGKRVIELATPAELGDFVRAMPAQVIKAFDLVDVVAGGDGFSGRRNRGIDPRSGRLTDTYIDERFVGDKRYHRVRTTPFVDGVFVPHGGGNEEQVDSAGNTFADFSCSENQTAGFIWAGGVVPVAAPFVIPTKLGDIDYASSGHGLIWLHANKGITFDLEAIRRANPGCKILRFRAVAGNMGTNPKEALADTSSAFADFWVLVDGRSRFRRRQIKNTDGAYSVVVPIGQSDRCLTLVATDSGDGISRDWIIFGDPRLELLTFGTNKQEAVEGR